MVVLLSPAPGLRPRRSVEGAIDCRNMGPTSLVDESPNDGQSDMHGQLQCGLVVCRKGREHLGQLFAALAPRINAQCPPGVAEAYQSNPSVFGVVDPGHQALP